MERPGSPSSTTVAPTSKRHSTNIEIRRSRLASERPPKKGVATKNAFRSGELTAISLIYSRSRHLTAPYQLLRLTDVIDLFGKIQPPQRYPEQEPQPGHDPAAHADAHPRLGQAQLWLLGC